MMDILYIFSCTSLEMSTGPPGQYLPVLQIPGSNLARVPYGCRIHIYFFEQTRVPRFFMCLTLEHWKWTHVDSPVRFRL